MRAAVFGGGGMLGVALIRELEGRGVDVLPWPHALVDIADPGEVARALDATLRPDVVFNAAGILNTSHDYPAMIRANALGPHVLARAARVRDVPLIHVSTDCVFSGRVDRWAISPRRGYTVQHYPEPIDLYGRTKLVGEVDAPHVTNVRTSFVGPDHGLWPWLVEQAREGAKIEGWTRAKWTGSTVWAVASALADLAETSRPYGTLLHLATGGPISKYEALVLMRDTFDLDVEIVPTDHVYLDRALHPTHVLPPFAEALYGHDAEEVDR